jgi:peptidyl-prolyl cis-trans isomerase C
MVVFFLFSTGNAQDADPVLGKLGDYLVRQSDMDRFIGYHPASEQKGIRESPDRMLSLLRRMLEAKAVANIARQEKFHERPEVKEQLGYIEDDFLSREYLKKVVMAGVKVTEEEMREYYRENEESLAAPEQVRVRQILIRTSSSFTEEEKKKTRERAQHVLDRLREGEDFIRAVSTYSEDPDPEVRKSGGDLGFFTRGQMIEVIEDAAFSLKPGEISDLIETPFGFHIIRLEEYVEPKPRSFQEVKDLIRIRMEQDLAAAKGEEFIREAVEKVGMEISTDRIMVEDEVK